VAYALRAYWQNENENGVTDRIEIYQDGFVGAALALNETQGFNFQHQFVDGQVGLLSPQENRILMGVLTFTPFIDTTAKKQLVIDIADAPTQEFRVILKRDGAPVWYGHPSGRVFTYNEESDFFLTLKFKDFDFLNSVEYPLEDNRVLGIAAITQLLGFTGYGWNTTTVTSWQEENTTLTDDFLNQVRVDTYGLRNYGRNGDEEDSTISVYEAIKRVATPALLIMQWNGFQVRQLSAYSDPSAVLQSTYNASGTQLTSLTVDARQTAYTSFSSGTPLVVTDTINKSYPALNSAKIQFNHRLQTFGISIPSLVELDNDPAETGTITLNTATNEVTGVGVDFNNYNEGDTLYIEDSGELKPVGVIDNIFAATIMYLDQNSPYTSSGVDFWINQTRNKVFTQAFVSDGTQSVQFFLKVFFTGVVGGNSYFVRYRLKCGQFHWDAATGTWSVSEIFNTHQVPPTFKIVSELIETDLIPIGAVGDIELTLFHIEDDAGDFVSNGNTEYQDSTLSILERSVSRTQNVVEYKLKQSQQFAETLELEIDYYGDSITEYSAAFFRYGSGESELTTGWRRRGETTFIPFHHLKLREVLDFQRTRTERKEMRVVGEVDPLKALVYNGKNYFYIGCNYNGVWRPVYIEIREQTAADSFNSRFLTNGAGETTLSNPNTSGGITQAAADLRYFSIDDNLNEGNVSVMRGNLGLGETDAPTFNGLQLLHELKLVGDSTQARINFNDDFLIYDDGDELFISKSGTGQRELTIGEDFVQVGGQLRLQYGDSSEWDGQAIIFQDQGCDYTTAIQLNDGHGNFGITANRDGTAGIISSKDGTGKVLINTHGDDGSVSLNAGKINEAKFNIGINVDSVSRALRIGNPNNNIGMDDSEGFEIADYEGNLTAQRSLFFQQSSGESFLAYKASSGSLRRALQMDADNDLVALNNQASNGVVQIRANTATGGESGEITVAEFQDDNVFIYQDTTFSNDVTIEQNLFVEGGLFASEFVIDQTRVFFNFRMAPSGGKIASVIDSTVGLERVQFQDENGTPFVPCAVDDILIIKQRTGLVGGVLVKNIKRKVASIAGNIVNLTTSGITWTTGDDVGTVAVGDHMTGEGNTSDPARDHYINFDISDSNAPAIRIINGADDVGAGDEIVTIGNMNGNYGVTSEEFGFGAGDTSKVGNYIYFTENEAGLQLDVFKLNTPGVDIDSEGTGLPTVNEKATDTTASTSFKSATVSSRYVSNTQTINAAQKSKVIRFKFSYTISGADGFYDIRLRPQLRAISGGAWSDVAFSNVVKSHPSVSSTFFDTNSGSTLSDTGTGSYSEWRLQETTNTISGDVVIYLASDSNAIDYSLYDAIRLTAFHQGGAEVVGSFSAETEVNVYANAAGLGQNGFFIRVADTLFYEFSPISAKFEVFQDQTLID
jgi:hypothetical protein